MRAVRIFLVAALALSGAFASAGVVVADTTCDTCSNTQDGDNAADASSGGASGSGDAVGGQVNGIVSSGDASVDAKNRSEKADVESGQAVGSNSSAAFAGLAQTDTGDISVTTEDVVAGGTDVNVLDGDNEFVLSQTASASSGDGVAGQVIGVVTSSGGSADVVADNASKKIDVVTGDADASNSVDAFVGLALAADSIEIGPEAVDVTATATNDLNAQDGDNTQDVTQSSDAASGDGVGGQVLGVVSAGDASLDARNRSEKVDLDTGDATTDNTSSGFTGLALTDVDDIEVADVTATSTTEEANAQEGDNDQGIDQAATASSGDAVGGQVAGIVTSAGGSADVVVDNASKKVDVETGDADATNVADGFVGLALSEDNVEVGPVAEDVDAAADDDLNAQEGDNSQDVSQSADATTGDGVGGQVLGVVSAGDASLDARNRSEKVDLETGAADASDGATGFTGLALTESDDIEIADVTATTDDDELNAQEGDNDQRIDQAATASSGDAVGGQVAGIVTSAGGSADVVADNSSKKVDVSTGDADASNEGDAFVGLALANERVEIGPDANDVDVTAEEDLNAQEGDNTQGLSQAADATTGDGVAGQVLGVVSAGDASLDARNRSEKVDLDTGFADADNEGHAFAGLAHAQEEDIEVADVNATSAEDDLNAQDGDNDQSIDQAATASSGDAVGGQVAGIVTSAGGSAEIVADNASKKVDVSTGDADADNDADAFVGLALADSDVEIGPGANDVDASGDEVNAQEGDNAQDISQSADATTGDGVAGQVLGVVSAGDASLDARNRSEKADLETGDAFAENDGTAFAGLAMADDDDVEVDDVNATAGEDANVQDGDNDQGIGQTATASSGDAVGGQVAGIVTSAGGSADVVADNASKKVDVSTGEADASNDVDAFVGLALADSDLEIGPDAVDVTGHADDDFNAQDGDNSQDIAQATDATTGDGVAGQVLGVVSAGDASLDARNRSEKVDLDTGGADADSEATGFTGLGITDDDDIEVSDVSAGSGDDINAQDGDNDQSLDQSTTASSGDAVGGQVAGIVTSAGGSADVVADNASKKVDVTTGDAEANSSTDAFVGLAIAGEDIEIGPGAVDVETGAGDDVNAQEGDNSQDIAQSTDATTGDGVAGQVLGVVSAGDASLDARNRSEKIDLETGDATASNEAQAFAGLAVAEDGDVEVSDVNVHAGSDVNEQDGDNDQAIDQTASASSGDAVGGQVAGVVTSAGGSADLVLDNASKKVDGESGDADFANNSDTFVGLSIAFLGLFVG